MGRADAFGRGYVLYIVGTLMVTLAGVFVLLRLVGRYLRDGIKADDWTILGALVLAIVFTVVHNLGIGYGLGKHGNEISAQDKMEAFKMLLCAQVLFKLVIGLAKVSILSLYLRVFTANNYFRWACISMIVITSVASIVFIFPTLFQCRPLAAFWDRSIPHKCMNDLGIWLSHALINIITDILILFLPVYYVSRLGLQFRDKVALIFVFLLGGFVCLISIIRSTTFPQSAKPVDVTYNFLFNALWATVEMNTAIICACLPIIRLPLSIFFPRVFGRSSQTRAKCSPGFFTCRSARYQNRRETNPSLSIAGSLPWNMHNGDNVVTTSVEPGRGRDLARTESEERIIDMETLEASCGGILKQTDVFVSETRMGVN
ncbi:integral membrane protein [Nannizzia gypsea CBS 118893]|uniref:Integral membrane protein n=1 Tax=Arthroderma gypseum (strain ATCC MYA-4604 / CBS 118893) TaxID=535722 RepID=E4UVR2_ARTGP|nr:integral membrane protein [Nannizzia gypsea CBS 118893]EFR02389.1 integral membrane protein [Nannizzia gypsea CBS 118893]